MSSQPNLAVDVTEPVFSLVLYRFDTLTG